MSVDEEIARLRDKAGARNDTELAQLLGLAKSSVASWRNRGRVPKRYRSADGYHSRRVPVASVGPISDAEMVRLRKTLVRAQALHVDDSLVATAIEAATLRVHDLLHEALDAELSK